MFRVTKKILVRSLVIISLPILSVLFTSCGEKTLKGDWTLMYIQMSNTGVTERISAHGALKFQFTDDGKINTSPYIPGYQQGSWSIKGDYVEMMIWLWGIDSPDSGITFDFDEAMLTIQFFDSFGTKYEYFLCREPKHFKMPENVMYLDTWKTLFTGGM